MSNLDYEARPSKEVARRILIETLHRLHAFQPLRKYSYVGFGAIQFTDFDLVHRKLGITKLTSIEAEERLIPRCHFNVPYKGINILEGTSTTILPTLDWTAPAIVWVDYTQRLRTQELRDLENLALVLQPGSVLAITLNCRPEENEGERRNRLAEAVGEENVPVGVSGARLGDWGLAKTQREIVNSQLLYTFGARGDGSSWEQLLNIRYRDGAKMQLIVGVVDHPAIHGELENCHFHEMDESSSDAEALEIEIPMLTLKERQFINQKLPARSSPSLVGIPQKALDAYSKFYRWMDSAS